MEKPSSAPSNNWVALRGNGRLKRGGSLGYWGSLLPAVAIITIFLMIPMILIAIYSVMEANDYGGVLPHFSLEGYVQFLFDRQLDFSLVFTNAYLTIAVRSVTLALATVVITLVVGFPIAIFIALQPPSRRTLLVFLITIPFWTNTLIRTYCWILLLRDTGVINSLLIDAGAISRPLPLLYNNGAILVGLVYSYAPFMVLPIYACVEKLDRRLIEAAYDLYAPKWKVLSRVILPLAKPGIVAGCILIFIPCVGAQIAPTLLGGGKKMMFGSLIFRQFTDARNWPFGSALAMGLLALVVLAGLAHFARSNAARIREEKQL